VLLYRRILCLISRFFNYQIRYTIKQNLYLSGFQMLISYYKHFQSSLLNILVPPMHGFLSSSKHESTLLLPATSIYWSVMSNNKYNFISYKSSSKRCLPWLHSKRIVKWSGYICIHLTQREIISCKCDIRCFEYNKLIVLLTCMILLQWNPDVRFLTIMLPPWEKYLNFEFSSI
jgi:hypothetical protein